MEKLKYLPILMYHKISKSSKPRDNFCLRPAELAIQLDYLVKKKYTALDFADLESIIKGKKPCPKKPVIITFDDAYSETLENAAPLLALRNLKGVFSIVTDYLGKASTWEKHNTACMTVSKAQIKEYKCPFISFESHTAAHRHLTQQTTEEIERDMVSSKTMIESITEGKVMAVFYPYGSYNEKVKSAAAKAGYKFGIAIATSKKTVNEDLFEMRRVFVKSSDSFNAFKRKISVWYIWFRGIRESRREIRRKD